MHANRLTAEQYVMRVCRGELRDPTLTFQLKGGFHVLAVVSGYLQYDPDSRGYAAVIEWLNEDVARPEDYAGRNPRFPNVYLGPKTSTTRHTPGDSNPSGTSNGVH